MLSLYIGLLWVTLNSGVIFRVEIPEPFSSEETCLVFMNNYKKHIDENLPEGLLNEGFDPSESGLTNTTVVCAVSDDQSI